MISVIVAIARNRAIGFENRLLYRLPDDLRRFKALTTGHTIIMGRKTFESFPKGALPNRRNIVLSKTKQPSSPVRKHSVAYKKLCHIVRKKKRYSSSAVKVCTKKPCHSPKNYISRK